MTESEKINSIHALQNVLNPRVVGTEQVQILTDKQKDKVVEKLMLIINSLDV